MINIELQSVLLAVLGMLVHILMHIIQRKNKHLPTSIKYFLAEKINWIRIVLALISTFALLLMADDVANILGINLTDGSSAKSVFAFLCGYMNHSIIRNLLKMFKK